MCQQGPAKPVMSKQHTLLDDLFEFSSDLGHFGISDGQEGESEYREEGR